jgi:3-hydroxybutyryl-CoA dehydrogenase
MEIKTLGVVGAGQMGSGIAQVAGASGLSVIMSDIKDEFLQRGANAIRDSLGRLVKKEKMTAEDRQTILGRITGTTSLQDMAKADFVVEAATENESLKLKIFTDLDGICRPGVILASNTSSISITKIAGATNRPEKVIGMHFMNPVPMMKLVEIIKGLATSEETFTLTRDLAIRMERRLCRLTISPDSSPTEF